MTKNVSDKQKRRLAALKRRHIIRRNSIFLEDTTSLWTNMALVKGIRGNGIGVVDITSDGSVIEVLLKVIIEEVGIINHVANMAEVGIV